MKFLTPSEAESKRQKAVEFLHRIGNNDLAEEFEGMDAREYAEHKGAQLLENRRRRKANMPRQTTRQSGPTKADLTDTLDNIADLAEEALDPELTREELVQKVKELADLASGEEDEEEDEGDEVIVEEEGADDDQD
jgi:methylthioribose-1-phosphate isomerase